MLALGIDQDWAELVGAAMRSKPTQRISLPTFRVRIPKPKTGDEAVAPPPPPLRPAASAPAGQGAGLIGWLVLALALLALALFFPLK